MLRREGADQRIDYGANAEWHRQLHDRLGVYGTCPEAPAFEAIFEDLRRKLPDFPRGHDADPNFARALFCIARHTEARLVVETGVARGVTSRFALEAMADRGGELWSIDLPPMLDGFHSAVGLAVPEHLRTHWRYVRGASQHKLEPLLRRLVEIDVFVHDSVGTRSVVFQELHTAWTRLRPHGWLIVGGINRSEGFQDFLDRHSPTECLVAPAGPKRHFHDASERVWGQFALVRNVADKPL